MSLQSYRSQLAAKQNRRLMVYFSLAIGIHAGGLWLGQTKQWLGKKMPPEPVPIEFVNVEPNQAEKPPPATQRQAQTNAAAARNPDLERPPQAGRTGTKASQPAISPNPSTDPSTIATLPQVRSQARSQVAPVSPLPQIAASPIPLPATTSPATPQPSAVPSPSPLRQTPFSTTAESNKRSPLPLRPVAPQPQSASQLSPPSNSSLPSAAAQLGDPLTASATLEGQGSNGQLNPNRSGNGSSVDAVQDDLWGAYLSALNQTVDRKWQRIAVEATRRTRVRFRVDRQGNLTDLRVIESSGDTRADAAAVQAIQAAAPFAPLPQNAMEEVLIVNFTFTQWR